MSKIQELNRPVRPLSVVLIYLGGVLLCAGLVLLMLGLGWQSWWVIGTFVGGLVLAGAGIVLDLPGVGASLTSRQAGLGFLTGISVLLAVFILILVNFIVARHNVQWDWTAKRQWTLSDRVKGLLGNLDREVTATVVFVPRMQGDWEKDELTRRMLQQFASYSPTKFKFEYVNIADHPESYTLAKKKFDLKDEDIPCVVFSIPDGRKEIVSFSSIIAWTASTQGGGNYSMNYEGESRFASAVLTLQGRKPAAVYFTTGHGELGLSRELTDIAEQLRTNFMEARACPALTREPVPDDCTALFIVGPETPFAPEELRRISDYLRDRKGSLYVAVAPGADPALETLLGPYGIAFENDVVLSLSSGLQVEAIPDPSQEVTRSLGTLAVVLSAPRSLNVGPIGGMGRPQATPLLKAGEDAYGETDLAGLYRGEAPPSFDPKKDLKPQGGLVLAAAYEETEMPMNPMAPPPPKKGPVTRIIVVGDSAYMLPRLGGALTAGNLRFFFESAKWLSQTAEPISVKPLDLEEPRLDVLQGQTGSSKYIFVISVIGVPLALLIAGGVVWLIRRG